MILGYLILPGLLIGNPTIQTWSMGDDAFPITISSRKIDRDSSNSGMHFTGSVKMRSSGLYIYGEEANVIMVKGISKPALITITGTPSKMIRYDTTNETEGFGKEIEYDVIRKHVLIKGHAWLKTGHQECKVSPIEYSIVQDRIILCGEKQ